MSGPREDALSHWLAALLLSAALCSPAAAQQRLSLNFANTDIEAVARAMADFTGRTIIVDPRVKGTVTLTVDQPVSAEQALATLSAALRMQNIALVDSGGVLEVHWTDGEFASGALDGELQVDWRDAQSALSPVVPLGSYRLRVAGKAGPASLELQTLAGPLEMRGSGKIEGSHIRFRGVAAAERDMQPALNGLLGLLGMRSGDKVLLAIDT